MTTKREQILELEAAGKGMSVGEIAGEVGCTRHYVCYVLRAGKEAEEPVVPQCRRCGFLDGPDNPVQQVGEGEWECLWCRMEREGVNLRKWYESGAWWGVVEPREHRDPVGGDSGGPGMVALRRRVREEIEERGHTRQAAADEMGMARSTLGRFLRGVSTRLTPDKCQGIANYVGWRAGQVWAMCGEVGGVGVSPSP